MNTIFQISIRLVLLLVCIITFCPIITTADEAIETEILTITTRTTIQLTSQTITSRQDQDDRLYESSILRAILVPTNPIATETTSNSQTSSILPLSSRNNVLSTVGPTESISTMNNTQVFESSVQSSIPTDSTFTESISEATLNTPSLIITPTESSISTESLISTQTTDEPALSTTESTHESSNQPTKQTSVEESLNTSSTEVTPTETTASNYNETFNNDTFEKYIQSNESLEEIDDLSMAEDAQFLSFEEWKKKKGAADHNQGPAKKDSGIYVERAPKNPVAKDSIGEEMEIDISNFFNQPEPEGKLYKDKFNFASFDCAATIVKTNSEAKGATSILFENKDSYLLNPCAAPNKFVVIELCQDILVDSVVMGNFEFFSSTFKKIQISVSETFPVPQNGWKILGKFDAKDIRDFQTFQIENPMIWAKYFRVEILEHYGKEFYCPLSVVRVHGRTMMQEYKQEEALQNSKTQELEEVQKTQQSDAQDTKIAQEVLKIQNETVVDCILTNQTVNNSIRDIQMNLTNITDLNLSEHECSVSLPQLKFDELFNDFKEDQSKCETTEYNANNEKPSIAATTQSTANTNTGTQESIYKNIMKRLTLLESNATLSVLYIEEQSKLLSTAFSNLEKKQALKFDKLIDSFNTSIYNQLENLSTLYSMFQKQTDELLTNQRLKHEQLLYDANSKIEILASDLKFQKILSFINGLILICILVYVVLTRDTYIETEQYPAAQQQDRYWMNVSKRRIASTGSRLKENIKRMYYNSDGGDEISQKSLGPSDEEIDDGNTTPSSNEKQEPVVHFNNNNSKDESKRPLTPDNSDHE